MVFYGTHDEEPLIGENQPIVKKHIFNEKRTDFIFKHFFQPSG